ncbi:MAG: TIGR04255 family protein [Akkermansiaceae bacterium]|nr:TIGR04255 family protein [Armatimonadota bacterium]
MAYFQFDGGIEDDSIFVFHGIIRDDFPRHANTDDAEGNEHRHVFTSDDLKRFVRVGRYDIAHHKLTPCGDGNDFRTELRIVWAAFREVLPALRVTHLSLRAINRIEPPDGEGNHEDYFATYPAIGSGVPNELFSVFMRLGLVHPERENIRAVANWAARRLCSRRCFPSGRSHCRATRRGESGRPNRALPRSRLARAVPCRRSGVDRGFDSPRSRRDPFVTAL